ncbi:MAG TPA: hypothetical protein VMY88_11390 [Acidimicrobiales bacterium]|nr:hypothetical protein [Acidimicrobiales bacterium]
MPSSDTQAVTASATDSDSRPGPKGIASSLVILLAGALTMFAVSRGAPGATDLPLLPPLDGNSRAGAESLTIAATPPPSSLGAGVVSPADSAPAYRLHGNRPVEQVVASLTMALGLTAGPKSRTDEQGLLIVDGGSDRVLRLENSPGYPWTLMRGNPDCFDDPDSSVSSDGSISCPSSSGAVQPDRVQGSEPSEGSGSSGSSSAGSDEQVRCEPVDCPEGQACAQVCPEPELLAPVPASQPTVQLPPAPDAEARAGEVLRALGLEVARSTLSVAPDGSSWQVLAEPAVRGIPVVGMDTQLSIGEEAQVVAGSGMIPDADLLGTYPLITAGEALVRLQQIHSANDQPQFDGREPALGAPEPAIAPYYPSMPPSDPSSVTGLRLVLLFQTTGGGPRSGAYLVPAFLVDASDGSVYTVPAAIDEHLTPT